MFSCNNSSRVQDSNLDSLKKTENQIVDSSLNKGMNSIDSFYSRKNFVEIDNKKIVDFKNKKNLDTRICKK